MTHLNGWMPTLARLRRVVRQAPGGGDHVTCLDLGRFGWWLSTAYYLLRLPDPLAPHFATPDGMAACWTVRKTAHRAAFDDCATSGCVAAPDREGQLVSWIYDRVASGGTLNLAPTTEVYAGREESYRRWRTEDGETVWTLTDLDPLLEAGEADADAPPRLYALILSERGFTPVGRCPILMIDRHQRDYCPLALAMPAVPPDLD